MQGDELESVGMVARTGGNQAGGAFTSNCWKTRGSVYSHTIRLLPPRRISSALFFVLIPGCSKCEVHFQLGQTLERNSQADFPAMSRNDPGFS